MIGLGNSVVKRKLAGASVPAAPINIIQPSLSGSGAVGEAVICNKGIWSGSPTPTYTYDFRLDSVSVQNSSSNSYTPLLADDGKTLTCLVTATNSQGSASEGTSNSIVIGIAPSNTIAPVVSGSTSFGSTLTTTDGTWSGTAPIIYTYQWKRNGIDITGEIANTYVIGSSDSLASITCEVKGTNAYGFDTELSNTITVDNFAPVNTVAPTLSPSGTQSTGTVITVGNGTFAGTAPLTYAYRWKRNGSIILGETANTYTIIAGDDGTVITAEVKATNAYGESAYIGTSNQVDAVNAIAPVNTVAPVVSGTAVVGQTLSTTDGTWTGIPTPTYSYQWYRGATLISGATNSTYTLVSADAGQNIKCTVTATNTGGSTSADSNTLAILATLLDLYPNAAAAYSVRLLRGAYYGSPAIRVRRASDNVEQNIGFTATGDLDTSALTTFIGSSSGFVTTWYDQTTGAANFVTATPTRQPRIVNAGVLQALNGKPIIRQVDGTTGMLSTFAPNSGTTNKQILACVRRNGGTQGVILGSDTSADDYYLLATSGSTVTIYTRQITVTSQRRNNATWTPLDRGAIWTDLANQSIISANAVFNYFNNVLALGYRFSNNASFPMQDMQELIIHNTQTDTTGKETNMNNYYGAY